MTTTRRQSNVNSLISSNVNLIELETHELFKKKHLNQNKEIIHKNSELTKTNTGLQKQIAVLRNESLTLKHSNLTLKHTVFQLECQITGLLDRAERAEEREQQQQYRPRDTRHDAGIRQTLFNAIEALQSVHTAFSSDVYSSSSSADSSVQAVASTSSSSPSIDSSLPDNVSVSRRHSSAARVARPSISTRPELSYISEGEGSTEREEDQQHEAIPDWQAGRHILEGLNESDELPSRSESPSSPPSPTVYTQTISSSPTSFASTASESFSPPAADVGLPSPPSRPPASRSSSASTRLPPMAHSASTSAAIALSINKGRSVRRVSGLLRPTSTSSPSELDSVASPSAIDVASSRTLHSHFRSLDRDAVAPLARAMAASSLVDRAAVEHVDVKGKERERTGLVAAMMSSRTSLSGQPSSSSAPAIAAHAMMTASNNPLGAILVKKAPPRPRKSSSVAALARDAALGQPVKERELWVKRSRVLELSSEEEEEDEENEGGDQAAEKVEVVMRQSKVDQVSADDDGVQEGDQARRSEGEEEEDIIVAAPARSRPSIARSTLIPLTPAVPKSSRAPRQRSVESEPVAGSKLASRRGEIEVHDVEEYDATSRAGSVDDDTNAGEGRRARKSVNYALPKLNTKMRRPEDYVPTVAAKAAPRKSTHALSQQSSAALKPIINPTPSFVAFQRDLAEIAKLNPKRAEAREAAEQQKGRKEQDRPEDSLWSQEANIAQVGANEAGRRLIASGRRNSAM